MSDTGKQSPLGSNFLAALLQNQGLRINPRIHDVIGKSKFNAQYTPGKIIKDTHLRLLTYAINEAYKINPAKMSNGTYDKLISIGADTIPLLGNSKSPGYIPFDPSLHWFGQVNTGYGTDIQALDVQFTPGATWLPYSSSNGNKGITQWGFLRTWALQAWQEFNWNGFSPVGEVQLKDFTASFLVAGGYMEYVNSALNALTSAQTFQRGVFSSYNSLATAEVADISTATYEFGTDCEKIGKALDLTRLTKFGFPSELLQTIKTNGIITPALGVSLLAQGITPSIVEEITSGIYHTPSTEQEKQIYRGFLLIVGSDLREILGALNCTLTIGTGATDLRSLADLLDVRRLFPRSCSTFTVPLYNSNQTSGITTSKIRYLMSDAIKDANASTFAPQLSSYMFDVYPAETAASTKQTQRVGFGSYLDNILPLEVAKYAGAFSYTMQQVSNIKMVTFEDFAEVVKNLELVTGTSAAINLTPTVVSGFSQPANGPLVTVGANLLAIGSGPDGTLRMSDFLGCATSEPYPWELFYDMILKLQDERLFKIYHELYLACTWEGATLTVAQQEWPVCTRPYVPPVPNPDYDPTVTDPEDPKSKKELEPAIPALWDWYYKLTKIALIPKGPTTTSGDVSETHMIYNSSREGEVSTVTYETTNGGPGPSWNGTVPGYDTTHILRFETEESWSLNTQVLMGPNDVIVMEIRTGPYSAIQTGYSGLISEFSYCQGASTEPSGRDFCISKTPGDFDNPISPTATNRIYATTGSKMPAQMTGSVVFVVWDGSASEGSIITNKFGPEEVAPPKLLTNSTYYINIRNNEQTCTCCETGNCTLDIEGYNLFNLLAMYSSPWFPPNMATPASSALTYTPPTSTNTTSSDTNISVSTGYTVMNRTPSEIYTMATTQWPITSLPGINKVVCIDWDPTWSSINPVDYPELNNWGPNDAIIIRFGTGTQPSTVFGGGNETQFSVAEYGSSPSERLIKISGIPGDFGTSGTRISIRPTAGFIVGAGDTVNGTVPILELNSTYYLNIKNDVPCACQSSGVCDVIISASNFPPTSTPESLTATATTVAATNNFLPGWVNQLGTAIPPMPLTDPNSGSVSTYGNGRYYTFTSNIAPFSQYDKVIVIELDWNNQHRIIPSMYGGFGQNDLMVVKFTTNDVPTTEDMQPCRIGIAEWASSTQSRIYSVATVPGSFDPADQPGPGCGDLDNLKQGSGVYAQGVTFAWCQGNPSANKWADYMPTLQLNTTYYINITNLITVSGPGYLAADVFIDFYNSGYQVEGQGGFSEDLVNTYTLVNLGGGGTGVGGSSCGSTVSGLSIIPKPTMPVPPSITIKGSGGGYGRGGAPDPSVITIIPNEVEASVNKAVISRDDKQVPGDFGRAIKLDGVNLGHEVRFVTDQEVDGPGKPSAPKTPAPKVKAYIDAPPTDVLPVKMNTSSYATDGKNTPYTTRGWSEPMNTVVQKYVEQANQAISLIAQAQNSSAARNALSELNAAYSNAGTQLMIEQRARWYGIPPITVPYDDRMNSYPMALISFTDAVPRIALDTGPGGQATSLDLLRTVGLGATDVSFSAAGGNSLGGMLRVSRNQARLNQLGIPMGDNITDTLPVQTEQVYRGNGFVTAQTNNAGAPPYVGPASVDPRIPTITYTMPPIAALPIDGGVMSLPSPAGYQPLSGAKYVVTNPLYGGGAAQIPTSVDILNPLAWVFEVPTPGSEPGATGPGGGGGASGASGIVTPPGLFPRVPVLPINLNLLYMSRYSARAFHTVDEAISDVIDCNCDCWLKISMNKSD